MTNATVRLIRTPLGSLLLLLVMPCQSPASELRGKVLDPAGAPVSSALLEAAAPAGPVLRTQSDGSGAFQISGLPDGLIRLRVSREGFSPFTREFELANDTGEITITLAVSPLATSLVVEDVAGKATASRMEIANREIPVQVSSIPSQLLQQQGVNDMVNALRNVSGVSAQRWYGMYEYYTIRGFQIADLQLVDGMRLEGNRINTQLNNVEQVDVLKGPSSVLYGGQALSGAINIIRKKPQAVRAYDLFFRGGRFATQQAGGGATGAIPGTTRLLYRADFSAEHSAGWRGAGARRFNASPSLTWLLSDRHRVTVHQAFNRDSFDTDAGVPAGVLGLPGFSPAARFNTPHDFGLVLDSQTHILYNANLHPRLELRTGFFYRYTNDQYYSAETLIYRPARNAVDRQFLYFKHHRRPVLSQTDSIARFDFLGMRHTLLTGFEYQDFYNFTHRSAARSVVTTPIDLAFPVDTSPAPAGFPLSRIDYFSNKILAGFWQDQIQLGARFRINAGGRFDGFRRASRNDPWNNGQQSGTGRELRRRQNAYTYRAGLVFLPTENQQLYFSANSSFQPVTQIPADGRELQPETGQSYEAGYRWQSPGGRIRLDGALYQIRRQNVVIARPNQEFDQAGQQSSRGADVDLSAELAGGFRLIANYGYTLPRFDTFSVANGAVDLSGFRPRFAQRHAANTWITKSWRSGLYANAGARYLSSMFTNNANTLRIGGFTVFTGSVGFQRPRYEWSLNAENLLNRQRYFLGGIYDNQLYPGAPIHLFTTVRLRFP